MNEKKINKLSEKLYVNIIKNDGKKVDEYLSKGANAAIVLDKMRSVFYKTDRKILYKLLESLDPNEIEDDAAYFDLLTKYFVQDNDLPQIVEFVKKYKRPEKVLDATIYNYYDNILTSLDLERVHKYTDIAKFFINNGVKISDYSMKYIVSACNRIPSGGSDYLERKECMNTSYLLLKMMAEKIDANEINGLGYLKFIDSPIVEEDEKSISYIYEVCKVLMDAGCDLYGDRDSRSNTKRVDDICRKDTSGRLRKKLDDLYCQQHEMDS